MRIANFLHTRDCRLQMHARDLRLDPLGVEVGVLARAPYADYRPVPTSLEVTKVAVLLQMNLGNPLHIGDAVPARHDQAQWRSLRHRQRIAVQRPREHRFGLHRVFQCYAAPELLVECATF
jgi:hypothetical protein